MKEKRPCLICSSEEFKEIAVYKAPDKYEAASGVTGTNYYRAWARCQRCGFNQSHYSRGDDVLDRIYEDDYRASRAPWRSASTENIFKKVIDLPYEESETKQRVGWLRETHSGLVGAGVCAEISPLNGRFLDIGGATGVFAYEVARTFGEGWQVQIVDPAGSGNFLQRDWGLSYIQDSYRPGLCKGPFDLISLVYVLEHLREPDVILSTVRMDIVEGGAVYIEVPDSIAFERLDYHDDIFNSCHLWMFDPVSLTALLQRNGFAVSGMRRYRTIRGHHALVAIGTPS